MAAVHPRRTTIILVPTILVGLAPVLRAQVPDHPIITEVYNNPDGLSDGPIGHDPANEHQEFIELYLPPAANLAPGLNKDALNVTFYEVEGDLSSSGIALVNYRFDLPTFDLDASNGVTAGAVLRPASGVVVLGWVDYADSDAGTCAGSGLTCSVFAQDCADLTVCNANPPTALASPVTGLVNTGITAPPADYTFIAINGHHFGGTTVFPTLVAESLIHMPNEAQSGVIQNGSGAYLLVNRDDPGYVELYDDKDTAHVPPIANADPDLPSGTVLMTSALFDGFAANDDPFFKINLQPYDPGDTIDLVPVLPLGGAFSMLIPQFPEDDGNQPAPGLASGYARLFVDVPKTTENASPADDDPVDDAKNAYRHARQVGPFFPSPGRAALTTSPPELGVALAPEQITEVLAQTIGRPGILAVNAGGNFGIDMTAVPGASSNPAVATFASAAPATGILGQAFGFPTVAVTLAPTAAHGAIATAPVTVTATNSVVGDPPVLMPIQTTTLTATVLNPTTGQDAAHLPFQTTVFVAVQGIPEQPGVANEFLTTDLGAFVANHLGGLAPDTLGHGAVLIDPTTDISDGFFMQTVLVKEYPVPGQFINFPAPNLATLDLVQTVEQSAEVLSLASTYDGSIEQIPDPGVKAIRFNHRDTLTFGGTFTPSEFIHFADGRGRVAAPRSGLTNATTTRTFELAIVDTQAGFGNTIESGATDDFGIIVEVQDTEPGAPVVDGEFVFLSLSGGLQGADIDGVDVPPGNNVATIIYLDLDNLHDVLGIRSLEQVFIIDGSANGELDVVEFFSLNPAVIPVPLLAEPATGESLWRTTNNVIRLTFAQDITIPTAGQIQIQQMLPGGLFGTDIAAGFQFSVENDVTGHPRVLRIADTGPSDLVHRNWYAIRNTGGWVGVADFTVQYVVQIGDATNDGLVLNVDVSLINTGIPNFNAPDNDRRDIDGDGRVLNSDASATNARIPSFPVPIPPGH